MTPATPDERDGSAVHTLDIGAGGVASGQKGRHRRLPSIGQIGGRRSAAGPGPALLRFPTQQTAGRTPWSNICSIAMFVKWSCTDGPKTPAPATPRLHAMTPLAPTSNDPTSNDPTPNDPTPND